MSIHIELEILNHHSNSALLGVDPWIDLPFHDHQQWKSHKIGARKKKNKSEKRKKNEDQLREKERKDFDPKTCTTSN